MAVIYLVRHGEPDWEMIQTRNLHPCRHDFVPLTTVGISQAEELSRRESFPGADIILSSPYTRALQTASVLSKNLSLPISVEYDLHERLPDATFTVHRTAEILRLCGEWERHLGISEKPGHRLWEPLEHIRKRVSGVLSLYRDHDGLIVVCHELVIRSLIGVQERIPFCGIRIITEGNPLP